MIAARASARHPVDRSPAKSGRIVRPCRHRLQCGQLALDRVVAVGQTQRSFHPREDLAAVRKRAAEHEPLPVHPVTEQAVGNFDPVGFDHSPHRAAGADHQREAVLRGASAAHVVAGAVAQSGKPGDAAAIPAILHAPLQG